MNNPTSLSARRTDTSAAAPATIIHRDVVKAIGRELRYARLDLAWTRQQAANRVPGTSVNTLDRHEAGLAMCNLVMLTRRCHALAVSAPDLVELVMQRMRVDLDKITLHVDLSRVAVDQSAPSRLRAWAQGLHRRGVHRHGIGLVPPGIRAWLANATEVPVSRLDTYLAGQAPYSIRGSQTHPTRTDPDRNPPLPNQSVTRQEFAQALGTELRELRIKYRWTGANVVQRFPFPFRADSWYGYEYGTVLSSPARLMEIGQVFNRPAPVLLTRTLCRLQLDTPTNPSLVGDFDL